MIDNFYKSFEDIHRGTRESIRERLKVYLPFIAPWHKRDKESLCIDLGCGRGEWLELVTKHGFKAKGIDIDQNMLAECKKLHLDVEVGDAISALDDFPDASVSIISAFHLIEHIRFDQLFKLVDSSLRVLKEGGLLILETPNPENIIVSTVDFHIDPTHDKPIPPMLLEFLVTYCGFERYKLLRLNGSESLLKNPTEISLIDVLGGVSPNYAVVAQKNASASIMQDFNEVFSKEYGITLHRLSSNYDQKHNTLEEKLALLESRLLHVETSYEEERNAILNSKSWRYTSWLRKLSKMLKS